MPGSIGAAPFPIWIIDDPDGGPEPLIESATCLLPTIDRGIFYLFQLYRHYQNGVLYQAGGLQNQPAKYLELMEMIREALADGDNRP